MTKSVVIWEPAIGDEVYLRSGSQRMTIERLCETTDAHGVMTPCAGVVWMKYEEHEIRRDVLPIAVLDFKRRGP